MKVERKGLRVENDDMLEKISKLIVISVRDFRGSRRRRGILHCIENIQGKIPRFARNDSLDEVLTQTPEGRRPNESEEKG